MSLTPSSSTPRPFTANTSLGLKLTPSNSPYSRTPRSPNKFRSLYESGLLLKRIIGTTVNSPTGFDSLSSSRIFGYCAGAAVVITSLDQDLQYSQRFFRARPTAVPVIACNPPYSTTSTSFTPSTPTNTANDSRNRSVASLRDSLSGYSPSTPGASQFDWSDSPSSKTWTSRERIKAATCLSISRDGRYLAVGETGYAPRVLIFNLQESSDCPLVILNEHTFGVRAVAFSPDQKYLASLGSSNDGFLYIWSITKTGAARLHSSNKCTSFIRGMVWMGNSLITVGTRHIKVWRLEEGSSSPSKQKFNLDGTPLPLPVPNLGIKTLAGRNCVLGALVESTFTCVAAISDRMAVICSEKGDICLLDDNDGQRLIRVGHTGFSITCIAVDPDRELVCIGGRVGQSFTLSFEDLVHASPLLEVRSDQDPDSTNGDSNTSTLCAMAFVDGIKVTVDSQHLIEVKPPSSKNDGKSCETKEGPQTPGFHPLTAHRDPVLGVRLVEQPNDMQADFFTWSSTGEVYFWDLLGRSKSSLQVELEQLPGDEESANQCQVIRASVGATFLVTGDKLGVLRIIDGHSRNNIFGTKAHGSEILDIAIHEGTNTTLVASCGRDRTVQLFRKMTDWTLLQTMDEHTASVNGLLFCEGGEKLISCSSDRSIQIRQISSRQANGQDIMAAIPIKVISLKASPVSMALSSINPSSSLLVSSLDRSVATYDISSGKLISSFRATDGEGNDAVVMDALIMGTPTPLGGRPTILAGLSSTDKSVRLYDGITGAFVDREWGHTASVTGVALLETTEQTTVLSTGADGTIMIWDLTPRMCTEREELVDQTNGSRTHSPPKEPTSSRPPLRRVLSKAELAEFSRHSPSSTPTGRASPPRPLRRKTSKYAMSIQSPKLALPPIPSIPSTYNTNAQDADSQRNLPRSRSRSPPISPKAKVSRRPSLASLDIRGRTRSTGNFSEFGTSNMATEQVCRTLRAYRKRLGTMESIRDEVLRELDQELRLTAKALGEKTLKTKAISETVLAGLLDQYSDRLVSIFDEKLRLSLSPHAIPETGPSTNGH